MRDRRIERLVASLPAHVQQQFRENEREMEAWRSQTASALRWLRSLRYCWRCDGGHAPSDVCPREPRDA